MSTEFISFQPPPGNLIAKYDRSKPSDQQDTEIPATFKEAMAIREAVFVHEQGVPLENELDADDPRSFHWVVYASVSASSPTENGHTAQWDSYSFNNNNNGASTDVHPTKPPKTNRIPVGTIRLVPPPHPPHPAPHSEHKIDNAEASPSSPTSLSSGRSSPPNHAHAGGPHEPYVKLGRLAVLSEYRGLGLARLLVKSALQWASEHADDITPPADPARMERVKAGVDAAIADGEELGKWKGAVLIHAQSAVQGWWAKLGFVKDDGMGTWDEEGIEHVGMWKRVEIQDKGMNSRKSSVA